MKRFVAIFLAALLVLSSFTLAGCSSGKYTEQITSIEQLEGTNMGTIIGSVYDETIKRYVPSANITTPKRI